MPSPDPAATVILLRDHREGFEVLMVERNSRGVFGSMFVFPGGRVDDCDIPEGLSVTDDESHRLAGIRELAEEAGILLTDQGPIPAPSLKGPDLYGWAHDNGHRLAGANLTLVSRWVTPEVVIDGEELIDHKWVSPDEALRSHAAGEMNMILPTLAHLRWLARRSTSADAISSALGADGRTLIRPELREDGSLVPVHLPAEVT